MFKHHRYPRIIILQAVYFKLSFTLSYRNIKRQIAINTGFKEFESAQRN
ncbi:hypothetical protein [Lentimicrobium sp. S6]|nr:hypothetical protein [Lentimicrobium sp. S6]NPD48004.1 hypothetical protein [Lentimicrobium sp. S6]